MRGKVCLVTGATSGIGLVTARELARQGASVFVVGRSAERAERAVNELRNQSAAADVGWFAGDLSSLADVRQLASSVRHRCPRLDVLVNNAGGIFLTRELSVDGIEMTWALNHLSYYLLTNLLLPHLTAGHPARVVNVASDAHKGASINFDDVEGKTRYSAWQAYRQSKLANILFTYELARRLAGTSVTVNALHPGFVKTNIFRHPTWRAWVVRRAADLIALSPDRGAETTVYLATSPEVAGTSGQYFVKKKPAVSSPQSHDRETASRVWEISKQTTGIG
jgi:NAD(P)-dependent dehydrogenase (short-subunit alcohol dehydrogenase family)